MVQLKPFFHLFKILSTSWIKKANKVSFKPARFRDSKKNFLKVPRPILSRGNYSQGGELAFIFILSWKVYRYSLVPACGGVELTISSSLTVKSVSLPSPSVTAYISSNYFCIDILSPPAVKASPKFLSYTEFNATPILSNFRPRYLFFGGLGASGFPGSQKACGIWGFPLPVGSCLVTSGLLLAQLFRISTSTMFRVFPGVNFSSEGVVLPLAVLHRPSILCSGFSTPGQVGSLPICPRFFGA